MRSNVCQTSVRCASLRPQGLRGVPRRGARGPGRWRGRLGQGPGHHRPVLVRQRQSHPVREHEARHRSRGVGRRRRRLVEHPGLRHRHRRERRRHHQLQDQDQREQLLDHDLPPGLLPGQRRPPDRDRLPVGIAPAEPAGLPHRRPDRPDRLRQLGRLGLLDRAVGRRVRHLRRQAEDQLRRRQPHRVRGEERQQHVGRPVQDERHHLAGLQRLRRQQRLLRERAELHRPCLQGQLQPTLQQPRRVRRLRHLQLGLLRRVPDAPVPGGERLQRQLHHQHRRRAAPQPAEEPQGAALVRPRRVLVGRRAGGGRGRP